MTAPPTKPRALRRLERLHDAKSLGRDKAQAQRLQKAAGGPSPQSYDPAPGTPPGGKITSTAPRPAPGDGTSPGRISDAYRAADALDLVEGRRAQAIIRSLLRATLVRFQKSLEGMFPEDAPIEARRFEA